MLTTSRRIAWPKWRVVRPERSAWRRLRDVVVVDLEVGVAGDAELRERLDLAAREQLAEVGADHARQQHEAPAPLAPASSGSRITRGSTRGTLTIAIVFARPKASLPPSRAMKFSDLFATCGNGCAGSSPTGTSSGRTSRLEEALDPAPLRLVAVGVVEDHDALALRAAGITSSLKTRVLVVDQRVRRGRDATRGRACETPAPGRRAASR